MHFSQQTCDQSNLIVRKSSNANKYVSSSGVLKRTDFGFRVLKPERFDHINLTFSEESFRVIFHATRIYHFRHKPHGQINFVRLCPRDPSHQR